MRKLIITLLVTGTFFLNPVKAQNNWTLEQCINYALQNNIQIKRQELQTESTKKDYTQSKIDLLPNLNAGFQHQIGKGSVATQNYSYASSVKQGSMGLQGSVTLFNGLQKLNTIQRDKYSFLAAESDLEKAKNDISLSIASAYLQILFDKELLLVAQEQLNITKLQVERTQKLVDVGNLAQGELLRIQAQAANEKSNVTSAKNNLDISYLNITQLLDLDSVGNFEIVVPENLKPENYTSPSVTDIYQDALNNMPQIKSAEYNVEKSVKSLAISKGMLSPEISLSGSISSRYTVGQTYPNTALDYSIDNQLKDNQYKIITFQLNIPIFNRWSTATNIQKSRIALNDAQYLFDLTKQALYKEIQQAYADAMAALQNYNSAQEAVASNKEAFSYTEKKFNVGLVNSLEYNQSKNDLAKAQSDLLRAKYQYIFQVKILDFYRGATIKL